MDTKHTFGEIRHQVWATFVGMATIGNSNKHFNCIWNNSIVFEMTISYYAVNILVFGLGTGIGWYSPALPQLRQLPSPLPDCEPLSDVEAGWIGASLPIGALIGNLGFGLAANVFGMKRMLLFAAAPLTVSRHG